MILCDTSEVLVISVIYDLISLHRSIRGQRGREKQNTVTNVETLHSAILPVIFRRSNHAVVKGNG